MSLFTLLLWGIANVVILVYGQGAFGRDDYPEGCMWILLFTAAVTIASVGFIPLQKKSHRLIFNGSNIPWSFSGHTYSFNADGEEWVVVAVGSGFKAGISHRLPMDGNNKVCMPKRYVRWNAWPHLFSPAWYKEHQEGYAKINYPELYSKIMDLLGTGGTFWFPYRYDPKDELDIVGSVHPDTRAPLTADDVKINLEIGSLVGDDNGTKRNTIIDDFMARIRILKTRIKNAETITSEREDVLNNTLMNINDSMKELESMK